jgi:hypothetical protein
MKHCPKCKKDHPNDHQHFVLANKLSDKGFPTHSKRYATAHKQADKLEKSKFGSTQYRELEKLDRKLSKHELAGKNTKSGKIEVSKKLPAKYDKEIAYHEKTENKILRKKK